MAYTTVDTLKTYLGIDDEEDFTTTAVDVSADTITLTGVSFVNSLQTADEVEFETTDTLPDPLATSTIYYVILSSDQVIKVSTSSANADAGTAVDLTDTGIGTHTIVRGDSDDTLLSSCIDRAQRAIESYTGKVFESVSEIRYYDENSVRDLTLYLDRPLLTVTTLLEGDDDTTADKTTISSDDYWLQPRNDGPPYYRIELQINATPSWTFATDGRIEVEGTWGYSTTPPNDIVQATLRWAAYLYSQKDAPYTRTIANTELGTVEIPQSIPADVRAILNAYRSPL